jgi:hypothetical protein
MMDLGWIASAAPIAIGVGLGLAVRRVIAANDQRRAEAAGVDQSPPAGAPKASKTLRRLPVPVGQR